MRKIYLLALILVISVFYSCTSDTSVENLFKPRVDTVYIEKHFSYEDLLRLLEKYEAKHSEQFITTDYTYRKQIFTKKEVIIFWIQNNAKVAVFKDAKFLVSLKAETGTVIEQDTVVAYKYFKPGQSVQYKYVTPKEYDTHITVSAKFIGVSYAPDYYSKGILNDF